MFSTAPQLLQKKAREWPGGPSLGFWYCIAFSSLYKGFAAGLLSFPNLSWCAGPFTSPPCWMPEQPLLAAGMPHDTTSRDSSATEESAGKDDGKEMVCGHHLHHHCLTGVVMLYVSFAQQQVTLNHNRSSFPGLADILEVWLTGTYTMMLLLFIFFDHHINNCGRHSTFASSSPLIDRIFCVLQ